MFILEITKAFRASESHNWLTLVDILQLISGKLNETEIKIIGKGLKFTPPPTHTQKRKYTRVDKIYIRFHAKSSASGIF